MINIINFNYPKINSQKHNEAFCNIKPQHDVFVPARKQVSFGSNSTFSLNNYDMTLMIAEHVESMGNLKKAQELYVKNFHFIDNHIMAQGKSIKPKKINDVELIRRYFVAADCLCSNLSVQAILEKDEDKQKQLHESGKTYLSRTLKIFNKYCDKNVLQKEPGLTTLFKYKEHYDNGVYPVRDVDLNGESQTLIDAVRDKAESFTQEFDEPIEAMTPDEVLKELSLKHECIDEFYPNGVSDEYFHPDSLPYFDRYTELVMAAVNNRLKNSSSDSHSDATNALELISQSRAYLEVKDPNQMYWDAAPYDLEFKRIAEFDTKSNLPTLSQEQIDSYMDLQDPDLSFKTKMSKLDNLKEEPHLLKSVALFNQDNELSKYAIHLISKGDAQVATQVLRKIVKVHPNAEIKLFAAKTLSSIKQ